MSEESNPPACANSIIFHTQEKRQLVQELSIITQNYQHKQCSMCEVHTQLENGYSNQHKMSYLTKILNISHFVHQLEWILFHWACCSGFWDALDTGQKAINCKHVHINSIKQSQHVLESLQDALQDSDPQTSPCSFSLSVQNQIRGSMLQTGPAGSSLERALIYTSALEFDQKPFRSRVSLIAQTQIRETFQSASLSVICTSVAFSRPVKSYK